ncbi:MAG: YHS domain-containing protein [Gammaproteobacteria bacterium]|nr:YHS domain-containing protein [Gammaproteobacteria bacterium]MCY4357916.1 YHS domain-containing protein [Gammaproteobacteria bacterium]
MRKLLLGLIAMIVLLGSQQAAAIDAIYTGFFSNEALRGYDTVAYFTQGMPVEGRDEFSTEYQGAVWKFSSQDHLDMFTADPQKYAPQYGGYCAWAMSNGETASAEPDLWTIHEGKLYLNYSRRINRRWLDDMVVYIQKADIEWPKFEKE